MDSIESSGKYKLVTYQEEGLTGGTRIYQKLVPVTEAAPKSYKSPYILRSFETTRADGRVTRGQRMVLNVAEAIKRELTR